MVVMKFGGTSVADVDAVRRLVQIAADETRGPRGAPVVVVSALARVTDGLLEIAQLAREGDPSAARQRVAALRQRHVEMAGLVSNEAGRAALARLLLEHFAELDGLVHAFSVLGEVTPRSQDTVAAIGELASSRIVAAAIQDAGIPAEWIDARAVVVTDATHTAAQPNMDATRRQLTGVMAPLLARGVVPVMGGYIGATAGGVTTTLGRGGSDYSGAIVGSCLDAEEIQIWTDVDGMLTADPRIVDDAMVVPELSFEEASELAYFGAKVLHPSTIQPALARNIPVRILNSRRPTTPGTLIAASPTRRPGLTAIACKRGVTRIDIASSRMLMAYGFLRRVFEVFERHRTAVDVVTTSEVSVSVTVDDRRALEAILDDLAAFAEVTSEGEMAIVCAVGDDLRRDPTLAARVLGSLEDLPVSMVSQGGSRRNLTLVVPNPQAPAAMQRLHERFFTSRAVWS